MTRTNYRSKAVGQENSMTESPSQTEAVWAGVRTLRDARANVERASRWLQVKCAPVGPPSVRMKVLSTWPKAQEAVDQAGEVVESALLRLRSLEHDLSNGCPRCGSHGIVRLGNGQDMRCTHLPIEESEAAAWAARVHAEGAARDATHELWFARIAQCKNCDEQGFNQAEEVCDHGITPEEYAGAEARAWAGVPALPSGDPGPGLSVLGEARERVRHLHRERARLMDEQLAAELDYLAAVAAEHQAGLRNWWGLIDAYNQVRDWGISGFSRRWLQHIPYDLNTMRRLAAATPHNIDGTWSGTTGWEGIDTMTLPAKGTHVAFALFGADGAAVHIGASQQIRAYLKQLHESGMRWTSWKAWPCVSREDAFARRDQISALYHQPDSDTAPAGTARPTLRAVR
jgi:hypothetical protein